MHWESSDCQYLAKDPKLEEVGWYRVNSTTDNIQGTHEVGLKRANRLNLYDMSGNIQEWCNDYFGGSEKPEDNENIIDGYVIDPVGPSAGFGRIQRGGDYANYARCCAVSSRGCSKPYARGLAYGFRICRSVE